MNKEYNLEKGSIVLFHPGDNHACVQSDEGTLDYRVFNISAAVVLDLAEEVTGKRELPGFSKNVIYDEEATCYLRPLHEMMMKGMGDFGKEETLLFFISTLIFNIFYLGLGASALCFVTWNFAVRILGAVKTSIYIYIVPVITVVTSVLILREPVTWISAVGTLLAIAGLFLSEYSGKTEKKERLEHGLTK